MSNHPSVSSSKNLNHKNLKTPMQYTTIFSQGGSSFLSNTETTPFIDRSPKISALDDQNPILRVTQAHITRSPTPPQLIKITNENKKVAKKEEPQKQLKSSEDPLELEKSGSQMHLINSISESQDELKIKGVQQKPPNVTIYKKGVLPMAELDQSKL